jgi:hypothetical protein
MGLMDFKLGDVGSIFKDLREAITGEKISDPELKLKLLTSLQEAESKMMEAKAKTIVAEASSDHWIVAAWRPIAMLTFVVIIANNYIIAPYLKSFGFEVPTLDIPPDMWTLIQLGLTGYIVGRSAEKTVSIYKGNE